MPISVPERTNREELEKFVQENATVDSRGIPTLVKNVANYLRQSQLADNTWSKIEKSVAWLNREPKTEDNEIYSFYDNLSTAGQRAMCEEFGLDYDSFDSVEDVVVALVDEHKRRMS